MVIVKPEKRVMLVFPFSALHSWSGGRDIRSIPVGISYLAGVVKEAGYDVMIVDLEVYRQKMGLKEPDNFETPEAKQLFSYFIEKLCDFRPDVVGINCLYSGLFPTLLRLSEIVKSVNENTITVIGGIHPTTYFKEITMQYHNIIDFIIRGEAEHSFIRLLNYIFYAEGSMDEVEGGVSYNNGNIISIDKKTYIDNLDMLPFPAVDLLNIQDYFMDTSNWYSPKNLPINAVVPVLTSRSCPVGCNFCNMNLVHGKKIRYRSPENVVDEIEMYVNKYGLTYFSIMDDNFTINKKRVISIMNLIKKRNLNIQFTTDNGVYVNTLDDEVLDALVDGGLVRLCLAFETGSDYIRNIVIGKGLYNKKIYELRDLILSNHKYDKIFLYGYFIIGFAEETDKTLDDTFALMNEFPLDKYIISFATPFPGTKLYEQCKKENLFVNENYSDMDQLVNSGAVYYESENPHIKPYDLPVEELVEFKHKALELLKQKRNQAQVPFNYPLRYNSSK